MQSRCGPATVTGIQRAPSTPLTFAVGKAGDAARSQETPPARATPQTLGGGLVAASRRAGSLFPGILLRGGVPVVLSSRVSLAIVMAAAAALSCAGRDAHPAPSGALRDDFGDALSLAAEPRRIVSLNPTTTELLFALGAGSRLVGRTHWDSSPDSARLVPDLGPGLEPDVEAVLATHPDLVVLYASADDRAAATQLRATGVATLALRINTIADFRRAVRLLGRVVHDTARAATVVDTVDRTLARVRQATTALPRPRVFWHVWDAPLITIGGGSYLNELLTIAGGDNIYGALPDASPQISMEDLVRRDPDVILTGPGSAATIRSAPAWQAIRAVRQGHVLVVDTALVGRPSVQLGEAAVALARLLHPGAVR